MNVRIAVIICFILAMMIASFYAPAYCQDAVEVNKLESVEGEVIRIDYTAQEMVVKWMSMDPQIAYNETTFLVTPKAKIIKGSDSIGFMDIDQFDRVTVIYFTNSDLSYKVIRINVVESD